MAALVIRPRRAVWICFLTLFGYFFVGSLAMLFPRPLEPVLDVFGIDQTPLGEVSCLPWLLVVVFGFFVVLVALRRMSPVLRLTRDGLEIGTHRLGWSDIEDWCTPRLTT